MLCRWIRYVLPPHPTTLCLRGVIAGCVLVNAVHHNAHKLASSVTRLVLCRPFNDALCFASFVYVCTPLSNRLDSRTSPDPTLLDCQTAAALQAQVTLNTKVIDADTAINSTRAALLTAADALAPSITSVNTTINSKITALNQIIAGIAPVQNECVLHSETFVNVVHSFLVSLTLYTRPRFSTILSNSLQHRMHTCLRNHTGTMS